MEYTKLGNTWLSVSRICLGCMSYGDKRWREWVISGEEAREHFAAVARGRSRILRTADVHSTGVSEEITGRWLGEMAARDDLVIATKVNGPMGLWTQPSRAQPQTYSSGCDASLRRLKTDSIDLYQIHRWDSQNSDRGDARRPRSQCEREKFAIPAPEHRRVAIQQGALHGRASTDGIASSRCKTITTWFIAKKSARRIPLCIDQGVGVIPWSPLARGFLAGN